MGEAKRRGTKQQRIAEAEAKRMPVGDASEYPSESIEIDGRRALVVSGGRNRKANEALVLAAIIASIGM